MNGPEITVRPTRLADAGPLCDLLNTIIRAGGTTAMEDPLRPDELCDWFIAGPRVLLSQCVLADGVPAGFQTLTRHDGLPADWGDISSFTRRDPPVRGLGRALFGATLAAARAKGLVAINATIRADNVPGLGYYRAMGFRQYGLTAAVPLRDGRPVDRLHHRLEL